MTVSSLLLVVLIAIVGWVTAKNLPSLLDIILLRNKVSAGARYAVATLVQYVVVLVTILICLGTLGASASQLGWAATALSVGIGFGLQEIVANFVSGLILLFERPVRVGDTITLGTDMGTVTQIRIRATTIRDFDRKELLIPNRELITGRLLNWTLSDAVTRIVIPVGVAYGSDVEAAMRVLLDVAAEDGRILEDPAPSVLFEGFADSSLNLVLRAFVPQLSDRIPTMNDLRSTIHTRFAEAGITIPFPQRDVHLIPGPEVAKPGTEDEALD